MTTHFINFKNQKVNKCIKSSESSRRSSTKITESVFVLLLCKYSVNYCANCLTYHQ